MIDKAVAAEKIYIICGHYTTHKHPDIQHWLARYTRFHAHSTPVFMSWLNVIERSPRRGIGDYIDGSIRIPNPLPFRLRAWDSD
jgi:hypothetical protein